MASWRSRPFGLLDLNAARRVPMDATRGGTVCRRAERRIVSIGKGGYDPLVVTYMNRLSDLLFVMARAANDRVRVSETEW